MNILIAGASGFVASGLIRKLTSLDHQVLGISRNIKNVSERFKKFNNVRFLQVDIVKEGLNDINFEPEIVINLAAVQPSNNAIGWKTYFQGNVELVGCLLDFCNLNKVKKLIHTSTTSIYSNSSSESYNENSVPHPTNLYSLSKYMGENLLRVSCESSANSPEVIVLRFPSVFGSEHLDGLVYTYYSLAKENKEIEIYNEGKTMRNLLYIDDAVNSVLLFVNENEAAIKFDQFLVGSANSLSSIDIASYIKQSIGSNSTLVPVNKSSQINEDVYIDTNKLQGMHNFKLKTIEEGLNEFLRSLEK